MEPDLSNFDPIDIYDFIRDLEDNHHEGCDECKLGKRCPLGKKLYFQVESAYESYDWYWKYLAGGRGE